MVLIHKNSVEETSMTTSAVDLTMLDKGIEETTPLENNKRNSIIDSSPEEDDTTVNNKKHSSSPGITTRFKVCCILCISSVIFLAGVIIVCTALLIARSPLFKEDCCVNSTRYETGTQEVRNVHSRSGTNPSLLIFLNVTDVQKQQKKEKNNKYIVSWVRGKQGYEQDMNFTDTDVFIPQTGIYLISIYLQIDVAKSKKKDTTFCNLVLNIGNGQKPKSICSKNSLASFESEQYRFAMSLTLTYKLEKGQKLYVSMSPIYYLSSNGNSTFFSIHML